MLFFFVKQKTAYEMRISDWSSDVCSSDLTGLVELGSLQRRIRGAEGDGLGLDLLDAAARTDRLVVQADARVFLIGVGPLGVDRIGEGGAGAGDVGGQIGRASCRERVCQYV